MRHKKKRTTIRKSIVCISAVLVVGVIAAASWCLAAPMSSSDDTQYIYIDDDDTVDTVYTRVAEVSTTGASIGFRALAMATGYGDRMHTGRYAVGAGESVITVFRRMKNGMQEPVSLTVPSVRGLDRLAAVLSLKLMVDSAAIYDALTDTAVCSRLGYEPQTVACMFIPDTYSVYWNTTVDNLLDRMQKESKRFWAGGRQALADSLGLTPVEVVILASIIDEETADNGEKPMIARMYYNRLLISMPLQADPTVKYALGDFSIRRIYRKMLTVDSPYNTYIHEGLPPGPIRIPTVAGIDAVLNMPEHDYLYMCAKEDFSGTHNFAVTYEEHLRNARKYSAALTQRGVK